MNAEQYGDETLGEEQPQQHTQPTEQPLQTDNNDDMSEPWASKRSQEIRNQQSVDKSSDEGYDSGDDNDDIDDRKDHDDDDYKDKDDDDDDDNEDDDDADDFETGTQRDDKKEDEDDDDDDEYEHPVLKEFSRKLSRKLSKIGSKLYRHGGQINWENTKTFMSEVQQDIESKLSNLGVVDKDHLNMFYDKFSDLKNFVGGESIPKHIAATRKA